jgi:hypothetical protein
MSCTHCGRNEVFFNKKTKRLCVLTMEIVDVRLKKGRLDSFCKNRLCGNSTDLNLLNEAREKTKAIIDATYAPFVG